MNGKKAKALRRICYGDKAHRPTQYKTLEKQNRNKKLYEFRVAIGPRRVYRDLKKAIKRGGK